MNESEAFEIAFIRSRPNNMLTVVYLIAVRYILKLEVTSVSLLGYNYNKQKVNCEKFNSTLSVR
jgi:hypothetical protein